MREEQPIPKKRSAKGRKTLMVFGILFILAGVFLGAFTCSFQLIIQASNAALADENSVESENQRLKDELRLLQDQNSVLQTELDRYKKPSSAGRK